MQITHRRILTIAVPIMLANATVPLLGAVDTFVVGQIASPIPIGAVAIGSLIISVFYWFFGFLRMGTTGLTAQAIGAQDKDEVTAILSRVTLLGVMAGCLIIVFQWSLFYGAFYLSPASAEVEEIAQNYLSIRVLTAPAAITLFGLNGWLIAQERTREVLILQISINGVNILLDLIFVLSLGWGVNGVALATAIAEVTGLSLGVWMCWDTLSAAAARSWKNILNRSKLLNMFVLSKDILLRTIMLEIIFVSFTFIGAGFGDVELAANHVLLQFFIITSFLLDGFAFAVEALAGKAFGAKNIKAFRQSIVMSSQWGGIAAVILAAIFAISGQSIVLVITKSPEVQSEAMRYLPYMIGLPFVCLAAFIFDGVYIASTRTSVMRDMMAVSLVIYIISASCLIPFFQNHGLWFALFISFLVRGATLAFRYPEIEASLGKKGTV